MIQAIRPRATRSTAPEDCSPRLLRRHAGTIRRALLLLSFVAAAAGSVFFAACSDASGQIFGGQPLFDAAPPGLACKSTAPGTGSSFSSLYHDYFGPTGVASCSTSGGDCHGSINQMGTAATGYICPVPDAGDDGGAGAMAECYATMTGNIMPPNAASIVPAGGAPDAGATLLIQNLRGCYAGGPMGNMPNNDTYAFSQSDVTRIEAWIAAGATNN